MIVRSGIPKPILGTAPQVPAAPLADDSGLLPFQFLAETKTTWVRIDNTGGAHALRVFPQKPPLDPAGWLQYWEIPASSTFEGPLEFNDLWLAGVGGTTTFKAMIGVRVL